MRSRLALLMSLSALLAAVAAPAAFATHAEDPDHDNIAVLDNCPTVANENQRDSDSDLVGDACDADPFASVDGRVSGGGEAYHLFHSGVNLSLALRSDGGVTSGKGRLRDSMTGQDIRILSADRLRVGLDPLGNRESAATGDATVNGVPQRYYLEVTDSDEGGRAEDYVLFQTADYVFGGHVRLGNLEVR